MTPQPPHHPDQYPAIRFVAGHRHIVLSAMVGATVLLCLFAAWQTAQTGWIAAAVIAGAIVLLSGKLALELIALIAEMLLPR